MVSVVAQAGGIRLPKEDAEKEDSLRVLANSFSVAAYYVFLYCKLLSGGNNLVKGAVMLFGRLDVMIGTVLARWK